MSSTACPSGKAVPPENRTVSSPGAVPTLHVVIPYYNEGPTFEPCARRVVAAPLPDGWTRALVVVDDHSHDRDRRTLDAVATKLAAQGHEIEMRRHESNRGKGAAIQTAFDAVLATEPGDDDLVVIQDADLEYDPDDFGRLMAPLLAGAADAVIGSRWGGHRSVRGVRSHLHAWGNGALTQLSNMMTGLDLNDMECCYKLLTVGLLRRLRPWLSEQRYGVEPQIVAVLARLGARVTQVAVSYDPRSAAEGKKIGWIDGVRAVYVIAKERVRRAPVGPRPGERPP
jgi:glycosyltransferase involved in cell wall biosynthesis